MIIYLYRWKLKPEKIAQFISAWSARTEQFRAHGSLGSRLHLGEDGWHYAYAQWPHQAARKLAFDALDENDAVSTAMHNAIMESHEVISLVPISNYLAPVAELPSAPYIVEPNFIPPNRHGNLSGHFVELTPVHTGHAASLFNAYKNGTPADWDYLPYGPFENYGTFTVWLEDMIARTDLIFYAISQKTSTNAEGVAAYSRIDHRNGAIEISHVHFAHSFRKTIPSYETIFLLLQNTFETLKYRRCEWKCNSLNEASKRAALRFGFSYEGRFRNATIVKGHNRDTDWFSIIDQDWPRVREHFLTTLLVNKNG